MKKNILWGILLIFLTLFVSCSDDDDSNIDKEKPTIEIIGDFQNCIKVQKGTPFTFVAKIADNGGLGSYSFDIHNNFDHHSHSTEIEECDLGEKKNAVNPFKLVQTEKIADAPTTYTIEQEFTISEEYDAGDYHFMVKVVDNAGWATNVGISFKVVENAAKKPESKIAKIHVMMHEGHLHGTSFHVNGQPKESPWRRRQDMLLVKKEDGWQQEVSDYKEEVGEGKPFALAKSVNLEHEIITLTPKKDDNQGGRHAFEFELFDADGNLLNADYTEKAKNTQFFFTIHTYSDNQTNEEATADNSNEEFFNYVYRDTNPSDEMYRTSSQKAKLLTSEDQLGEAGKIGMKGYFAFKKDQVSYKLNVHIVEWTNGKKPEGLKFNEIPEITNDMVVTKFSFPINVLMRNEYDDDDLMYEVIGKYYNMTGDELFDLDFLGDYDPEGGQYWM